MLAAGALVNQGLGGAGRGACKVPDVEEPVLARLGLGHLRAVVTAVAWGLVGWWQGGASAAGGFCPTAHPGASPASRAFHTLIPTSTPETFCLTFFFTTSLLDSAYLQGKGEGAMLAG